MAGLWDNIKGIGSRIAEGAARAVASFSERYQRNASLIYEQRAHLPRGQVNRLARQHRTGERLMTSIQRGAGGIGWPSSWSQDRARQTLMFRRWVFIACDRICSTVASLPPHLGYVRTRKRKKPHHDDRDGSATVTKRNRRRRRRLMKAYYEARYKKSLHAIKPHEEVEDVGDDHPCMRLLKKPNAWDHSPGQLWYELVLYLLLTGNAYLWVVPDKAFGKPLELWVIPSQWVWGPKLNAAGATEYEIMPYIGGAGSFTIPAEEIVHFAFKNPINKIDGYSPIQAGAAWIDVSESIDDSRYWTFKQGTQASGALELGPKYDPDDVDIDAIGAKFIARYQGERNAGQPIILPPDVKMVPLTIAPADMAYEHGFEQVRDSILALLAVPKGIAGITDPGSDRALWGERAVFMEQAIAPRLRYIAETFTSKVCNRWDDDLRMYWEDPTPPDPQQINADLNVDLQHGLRTPNEARAMRNLEPIDNPLYDEPWLQPNLQPLSVLTKQFEQQEQQAQQAQQAQQQQQMQAMQPQAGGGAPGGAEMGGGMPGGAEMGAAVPGGEQQPLSDQQAQQDQWAQQANQLADQIGAEDAAMGVNDQAWQDQEGAVKKAHEYNQKAAESGSRFRLELDATTQRWRARSLNGHHLNGHAVLEKKKNSQRNGTVSVRKSASDGRVTREDFGYAAPPKGKDVPDFAQCSSCHKFTGQSCLEFSPSDRASADGACDFYAYGTPIGAAGIGHESSGTTPEAAGYVERQVRCENCARSNRTATRCEFYAEQNKKNPKRFALDTVVMPQSCCNAQTPKTDNGTVTKAWELGTSSRAGVTATLLDDFPDVRQPNRFSCGASAACAVGRWYGVGPREVSAWEKALGTTVEKSTHPYAIRDYLASLGLQVESRQGMTLDNLADYTARGWPVIVCVQDYGSRREPGATFAYGHYLTVLSVIPGAVICQDSSLDNVEKEPGGDVQGGERSGNIAIPGRVVIAADTFVQAWHDKDVDGNPFIHFGIAVGPSPFGSGGLVEKAWEENKHPRGGNAKNPGQFSHGAATVPHPPPQPEPSRYPSFPGAPGAQSPPALEATRLTRGEVHPEPTSYAQTPAGNTLPSSSAGRSPLHQALEQSPATRKERLDGGVNKSFVLTLEDGTKGLYKPSAGERQSAYGIPFQTGYRREVAASRIADVLGLNDLVPITTFRGTEGDDIGSMQAFVPETLEAHKSAQPFDGSEDLARAAAFDYLLLNHDRHYGNWLLVHNKKLVLIDNGASLPTQIDETAIRYTQSYLLRQAAAQGASLPDLSGWRGKWREVARELHDAGIEDEAIDLAHERFIALTGRLYSSFDELPGFGVAASLGDLLHDENMRLWHVNQ